jgi:hypothetical protein
MKEILLKARCRFPNILYLSIFHISMKTFALMQHVRILCVHSICMNIWTLLLWWHSDVSILLSLTLLLVETLIYCLLMLYISTAQVLMFLQLCDWGFCLSGVWTTSSRCFLRNMMPSECQELVTQSLMVYPRRTELGTQWCISQKNRTGYPVTHVVYPRRTELGTQWLMWYIREEQNWVPSDSLVIFQKNRTGYPVTHLVYTRRTELGTQWLMWYIPEE